MPTLQKLLISWANSPDERCTRSEDSLQITVQAAGREHQVLTVIPNSGREWQVWEYNLPAVLWAVRETRAAADEEMKGNREAVKEWLHEHLHSLADEHND